MDGSSRHGHSQLTLQDAFAHHKSMPAFTKQRLLIVPHQSPSTVIITLIRVAIAKDEREDGLEEVHALPTFLPQSAAAHIVRVQIPEHI